MKAIDIALLQEHGVCHEQIAEFVRVFGEGARVVPTLDLCLRHADHFDWGCLALFAPERRAAHLERVAALKFVFTERKRLLEASHDAAINKTSAAYGAATVDARAVREAAQRDAADMRDWAIRAALDAFDLAKLDVVFEAVKKARRDYDAQVDAADETYHADPQVEAAWSERMTLAVKLDGEHAAAVEGLARQLNEEMARLWFEGIADSLGGEEREPGRAEW